MNEFKAIATILFTVALLLAIISGTVWGLNHQDWDAQRSHRTSCIEQGGVYVQTPTMEGCFIIQSPSR